MAAAGESDSRGRLPGRLLRCHPAQLPTDLRIFADWCAEAHLELFGVRRAHLELFGRCMEENGKMGSTVARRLSALASFHHYCEQEGLIERNPAIDVYIGERTTGPVFVGAKGGRMNRAP